MDGKLCIMDTVEDWQSAGPPFVWPKCSGVPPAAVWDGDQHPECPAEEVGPMIVNEASGAIRALYNSTAWKRTRAAYKTYRHGLCEQCLSAGLYTPGTQVHHIVHLTEATASDPSVALSFDNLRLLCDACHHAEHTRAIQRRYTTDASGHIIPLP